MAFDHWDERFLIKAKEYSVWSKDPSRKIGAVAVDRKKNIIVSSGYNGFPRGVKDTPERLNNKEIKYRYISHAEANCIYNACYTGATLDGTHLYVYGLPVCSKCALGVIQVGIERVICLVEEEIPTLWDDEWEFSKRVFKEVGIDFSLLNPRV